jgi:ubiquinone/menaquinone biosynthesis C-methylase UbiE
MIGDHDVRQMDSEVANDGIAHELQRISAEYENRLAAPKVKPGTYTFFNDATLLHMQGLERAILSMLKRHGITSLAEKRILDVGCGTGLQLGRFLLYGARPENLTGIDLLPARITAAQATYPMIRFDVGSGHTLPYPDGSFDLVTSFVVFSSILNQDLRKRICDEMWRVLSPNGLILCYDFAFNNPRNRAVQGISARTLRKLFGRPGLRFTSRRVSLAPPIARRIAPHAFWMAETCERLKLLNTHVLAGIQAQR